MSLFPAVDSTESGGAPETEITPAMIEIGFLVYLKSGITDDPMEVDKIVLVEIHKAIHRDSQNLGRSQV